MFEAFAPDLLRIAVRARRESEAIEAAIVGVLIREARDPNVKREALLERIEHGTHVRYEIPQRRRSVAILMP